MPELKPGWLDRQMKEVRDDVATWPEWMRIAGGFMDERKVDQTPEQREAQQSNLEMPLRATVEDGRLSVSIGNRTLAFAFENGEENNPYDDESREFKRRYQISDPLQFAADVCRAMNDEGEDGSTPLTRFLHQMMNDAVEQGSLGIHDPEDDDESEVAN